MDFFLLDTYENIKHDRTSFYLFGKVLNKDTGLYESYSVFIPKVEHNVYVSISDDKPETIESVLNWIDERRKEQRYSEIKTKLVYKRSLANSGLPDKTPYIQIVYELQRNLKLLELNYQDYPCAFIKNVEETEISPSEQFLLSKKIKGPCWLRIENYIKSTIHTYCKNSIQVLEHDIVVLNKEQPPPLDIASFSFNFKTLDEDPVLDYTLESFACIIHKNVPLMPFEYKEFSKELTQTFHLYYFYRSANDITIEDWKRIYPNCNTTLSTCTIQKVDSCSDLYTKLSMVLKEEDPDIVTNHGFIRKNIIRLLYEMQSRPMDIRIRSFFGRLINNSFSVSLKEIQNPRFSNLVLNGRLILDTLLLYNVFMKDEIAKNIRSDNLQEFLEGYGLQDTKEFYRSMDMHDTMCNKKLLFDDPIENGCCNFLHLIARGDKKPKKQYYREYDNLDPYNTLNACYQQLSLIYKLRLIPFTYRLSKMGGCLWQENCIGITSTIIEYSIMHKMIEKDYIVGINPIKKDDNTYKGGKVITSINGVYDGYSFLVDVESMYPSIIIYNNVCISNPTLISYEITEENEDTLILPSIVKHLKEQRIVSQKFLKDTDPESTEYITHSIESQVLKLMSNQCYGCLGYVYFRFYNRNIASFITEKGREILKKLIHVVEKDHTDKGFKIIYGHTDSLLIHKKSLDYSRCKKEFDDIYEYIIQSIPEINIKLEGIYRKIILLGSNKYIGVRIKNESSYDGRNMDNLEDIQNTYDLEITGCSILSRKNAFIVQKTILYVLHQYLLYDLTNTPDKIDNDIKSFLSYIKDNWTVSPLYTNMYIGFIKLFKMTSTLNEVYYRYKKPYNQDHLKSIDRIKVDKERFIYKKSKIEYIFCKQKNTISCIPILIEEYLQNPSLYNVDIEWYKHVHLSDILEKTISKLTSVESLFEILGINKSIHTNQKKRKRNDVEDNIQNYTLYNQLKKTYEHVGTFTSDSISRRLNYLFKNGIPCDVVEYRQPSTDIPFDSYKHIQKRLWDKYALSFEISCSKCDYKSDNYYPLKNVGDIFLEKNLKYPKEHFEVSLFNVYCPVCKTVFALKQALEKNKERLKNENKKVCIYTLEYWNWLFDTERLEEKGCSPEESTNLKNVIHKIL